MRNWQKKAEPTESVGIMAGDNGHRISRLIDGDAWKHSHILVVGDVMLDRYVWGDVERICPEAPVPVVRAVHSTDVPGGAANVAMNIAGLGARATVVGFAGEDPHCASLEECLHNAGVQAKLAKAPEQPTTAKLRIIGARQQMLRVDFEADSVYSARTYTELKAKIFSVFRDVDAVVLSDYDKGVLSEEVCRVVIDEACRRRIPLLVDPKHRDFLRYSGATAICASLLDLSAATGVPRDDFERICSAATAMLPRLGIGFFTVTLGDKGIAVLRSEDKLLFPAVSQQVCDISGAGDTVIATLAVALATGLPIEQAVPLANTAAGIVCTKIGTVPITRAELLGGLLPETRKTPQKIVSLDRLVTNVNTWRSNGQRIVLIDGCFDLIHGGHITLIESASQFGNCLVVAMNSDASVRKLKGMNRPFVCQEDRLRVLSAFASVDALVMFDEPTPIRVIEAIRPDVIVKGCHCNKDLVIGAKEVRTWGGIIEIVPKVEASSTARIVARAATPFANGVISAWQRRAPVEAQADST